MRPLYLKDGNQIFIDSARGSVSGELTHISRAGISVAVGDTHAADLFAGEQAVVLRVPGAGRHAIRTRGVVERVTPARRSGQDVVELSISMHGMVGIRPAGPAFAIPAFYQPSAFAPSPLFPGEAIIFRVTHALRDHLRLVTRDRDKGILTGAVLALRVVLPTGTSHQVAATVVHLEEIESGELLLDIKIGAQRGKKLWHGIGELLLVHGETTPRDLRNAGLPVCDLARVITVGYAGEEDMDEILALRLLAFHGAGKRTHVQAPEAMRDRFDAFSRQVVCRVGTRIVATARVTFNDGDLGRSEYISYGAALPDWLSGQPFAEIGRVVTDPAYRGGYIVFRLMQELASVALAAGIRYLLGSASDTIQLYERVGFRRLGVTYDAHGMRGVEIISLDLHKLFRELDGLDFATWNLMALPIVERIAARQDIDRIVPISPWRKVELFGHRLLHPAVKQIVNWRKRSA